MHKNRLYFFYRLFLIFMFFGFLGVSLAQVSHAEVDEWTSNGPGENGGQEFTLTLVKQGAGTGTVTSSPAGFDCGASCSAKSTEGTEVTLTAQADSDSIFIAWSGGGCKGIGECIVPISSDVTVTATFNRLLSSEVSSGRIVDRKRIIDRDRVLLKLRNVEQLSDATANLINLDEKVHISIEADGKEPFYTKEIDGSSFKLNRRQTRLRVKDSSDRSKIALFLNNKNKINIEVHRAEFSQIIDSNTVFPLSLRVKVTIGNFTYISTEEWGVGISDNMTRYMIGYQF